MSWEWSVGEARGRGMEGILLRIYISAQLWDNCCVHLAVASAD